MLVMMSTNFLMKCKTYSKKLIRPCRSIIKLQKYVVPLTIAEYRNFLAVAEADTVREIRVVLPGLATVDKTEGTVRTVAVDDKEIKFIDVILGV